MKSPSDDTDIYKSYSKDQLELLNSMNPAPKVISFKDFVKYIYEPSVRYQRELANREASKRQYRPGN